MDILVVVAIAIIPLMYGGLLTSAYQNPTNRVESISAAVVNEDSPANVTLVSGETKRFALGDELVQKLTDPDGGEDVGFTWHQMGAEEAARAMKDQEVRAILTIPAGFTERVTEVGTVNGADATPQSIELVTDDGVNYLAGTLAQTVAATLQGRLTSEGANIYTDNILLSLRTIRSGMEDASGGSTQLHDGAERLQEGLGTLADGTTSALDGSTQLSQGAAALGSGLGTAAAGSARLEDGSSNLANGASLLNAGIEALSGSMVELQSRVGASDGGADPAATELVPATAALAAGLNQLDQAAGAADVSALAGGVAQLNQGVDDYTAAVDQLALVACQAGPSPLCEQLSGLSMQSPALRQGVGDLNSGISSDSGLVAQFAALQEGIAAANAGAQRVEGGVRQVASALETVNAPQSIPRLQAGASQLAAGTVAAQRGAEDLATGLSALESGASTLSQGSLSLTDGLGELNAGAAAAQRATGALGDGAGELADALGAGAKQIPNYSAEDDAKIAQLVSEPVRVEAVRHSAVANNGAGFTPMFMSLSLWIGGIAIFLVLPALTRKTGQNERWWMAALRPVTAAAVLGVIQAVLLVTVTNWTVGLHAVNLPGLVGIAIASSLTFVAINQMFIATLAYRGRFASILLLCLQIASMGATFPLETTPRFFQWINPFLPMSYTQLAFRQMIAGEGATNAVSRTLAVLAIYFLVSVALIFLAAWKRSGLKPLPRDNALLGDSLATDRRPVSAGGSGRATRVPTGVEPRLM